MNLSDALKRSQVGLLAKVLPPLRDIERAVDRVCERWPDAVPEPAEGNREKLAQEFLGRVTFEDWDKVSVARILEAAVAAFDEHRAGRIDLAPLHDFLINEVRDSSITTFLSGMFYVYVGSFAEGVQHTNLLADALRSRRGALGLRVDALVDSFPDLLVPAKAPALLANIMATSAEPWQELKTIGFSAPHAPGLLSFAHDKFIAHIANKLHLETEQERLMNWLAPRAGVSLSRGAGTAIGALLRPWSANPIPADRQSRLAEWIVEHYGDPRTNRGGIWAGFDPELREVLLRWLAKEDMQFFCDVVTATQDSHMWPPRRDFWLKLHEQGRISEAWVAFGREAREYARRNLMREGATSIAKRFGEQLDRNASTSLLVMRIGNKIVVDGCQNYKTHVFDISDPQAPKLYQSRYFCNDIMRIARNSKQHYPIPSWQTWVQRQI
jgi:hypothetical protein